MKISRQRRKLPYLIAAILIFLISAVCVAYFVFKKPEIKQVTQKEVITTEPKSEIPKEVTPVLEVAKDQTLGSGFEVSYPKDWVLTHSGSIEPTATTTQTDENTLTSPSRNIKVILKVQTNIQTSTYCTSDYIKLKYLLAEPLEEYSPGRFAAYVVYFPSIPLYQYHVGLQKNTPAVQGVNLTSNTTCNFMFSEFIQEPSSIAGVSETSTLVSIRFQDVSSGQSLPIGADEQEIIRRLRGDEFEQAKTIVMSLRNKN